jgi:hypothetical protein
VLNSRAKFEHAEKIAALASPPSWMEPGVLTIVEKPPVGPNWRYEVKSDGYRLCIVFEDGEDPRCLLPGAGASGRHLLQNTTRWSAQLLPSSPSPFSSKE